MATVKQDIEKFQESGERNLEKLKRIISEEKAVAEKTQSRLSELASILREQFSDTPDEDMVVVKETITIRDGEGEREVTRLRGMNTDEKIQRRKERGEQNLKDIFNSSELISGFRNWKNANTWVRDSDDSVTANLIRKVLGDNSKYIEKRTERIEERESIEREINRLESLSETLSSQISDNISDKITNNLSKELSDKVVSETTNSINNNTNTNNNSISNSSTDNIGNRFNNTNSSVNTSITNTDNRSIGDSERELVSEISSQLPANKEVVSSISEILSNTNADKESNTFESATEKENKNEELSLFNKQNAILKGIFDNTVKLIDATNKLQILKDANASKTESDSDGSVVEDLISLASEGKVFKQGKRIFRNVLTKGKAALGKTVETAKTIGSKVNVSKVGDTIRNSRIVNQAGNVISNTANKIGDATTKIGQTISNRGGDNIVNKIGDTISNKVGDKLSTASTKIGSAVSNVSSKVGDKITDISPRVKNTFASIFEDAKTIGNKAATSNIAKNTINVMKQGTETIINTAGKVGGQAVKMGAKLGFKGVPILGTVISGGMNAAEYAANAKAIDEMVERGEITKEEAEARKSKAKGEATGGTVGGGIGTAIGGGLGAIAGPIGIAVGSTLGGIIGEGIGGWLGGWFSEEKPKVEQKEPEPPKKEEPKKSIHEMYVDRMEKIKSGEIATIIKSGRKEDVQLETSRISKKEYDRRVEDEANIIRKLDLSKNMTEEEIQATARKNVYNNTDLSLKRRTERYSMEKIASLDEKTLKAYNDEARRKHETSGAGFFYGQYVDVTMDDVKKAREDLKTFDNKETIEKQYAEKEKIREDRRNKMKRDTVYRTYNSEGKVVGETVLKNGEIVSSTDSTMNLNENEPFTFKEDEHRDNRALFYGDESTISNPKEVKVANNTSSNISSASITNPNDIGVQPRNDGTIMMNVAEKQRHEEREASKEMKVEVVNNNVQNINQTKENQSPMYSRNIDPSYVRTVDERHGIIG